MSDTDVLVVGGGNAGLCAGLAARSRGADVLILERTPKLLRGGNSKYTRNLRCVRSESNNAYSEEEFFSDLAAVTGPNLDEPLARMLISASEGLPAWMESQGVRWQPAMRGTLQLARTNRFFLGGGKALVNVYYERARQLAVGVRYDAQVDGIELDANGRFRAVRLVDGERIQAGSLVMASGGFESNREWLKEQWGPAAENFSIRGTAFNDGRATLALFEQGAATRGDPRGVHAVAVDDRSPRFDGGIVTRVDSIPFGVVVDREGRRFHDEGEDLWPKRYAIWGRLIAERPDQRAVSIYDSKVVGRFIPPLYKPYRADRLEELAGAVGLDPAALTATVNSFNRAAPVGGECDYSMLDGRSTTGLDLPKSNWALPIDRPPYFAIPLRPGITFTYLGLHVDDRARVLRSDGVPFRNIWAAGEVMAGNILTRGYLAGIGMTIGTAFGMIAGEQAARAT